MPDKSTKKEIAIEEDIPATDGASAKPRYTLDKLLAQCGTSEPLSEENRAWINSPSVGKELL